MQGAEQPGAKQPAQGFEGQQEIGLASSPLAGAVEPAGADQAVHMGVVAQVAAPGVQGHEQTRHGAEVALVGTQVEQTAAGAVEEQLRQERAVELPECEKDVRQGEDDVEMGAGQQLGQLHREPLLACCAGAARASAVAAGVILGRVDVALCTGQHMHTQGGLIAVTDAVGGAVLAGMQDVGLGVLAKVLLKHILQGRSHGASGGKRVPVIEPTPAIGQAPPARGGLQAGLWPVQRCNPRRQAATLYSAWPRQSVTSPCRNWRAVRRWGLPGACPRFRSNVSEGQCKPRIRRKTGCSSTAA